MITYIYYTGICYAITMTVAAGEERKYDIFVPGEWYLEYKESRIVSTLVGVYVRVIKFALTLDKCNWDRYYFPPPHQTNKRKERSSSTYETTKPRQTIRLVVVTTKNSDDNRRRWSTMRKQDGKTVVSQPHDDYPTCVSPRRKNQGVLRTVP